MAHLNEASRELYRQEVTRLVDRLNRVIPDPDRHLRVPDLKFNRKIGTFAGQCCTLAGDSMSEEAYPAYLASVTPTKEDREFLNDVFKEDDWIEPRNLDAN